MNERDRLLAEGPRVAPEPPTADGAAAVTPTPPAPLADPPPSTTKPARRSPGPWMRVLPIGVFGIVLAANAGLGKHAIWVIIPAIALLFGLRTFARRRR